MCVSVWSCIECGYGRHTHVRQLCSRYLHIVIRHARQGPDLACLNSHPQHRNTSIRIARACKCVHLFIQTANSNGCSNQCTVPSRCSCHTNRYRITAETIQTIDASHPGPTPTTMSKNTCLTSRSSPPVHHLRGQDDTHTAINTT